ncbi:MAG TPA: hypothetical protein VM677_08735 [Actinokineospora sp.]|nr:hypothetical protein [Actinokineospora sp.]
MRTFHTGLCYWRRSKALAAKAEPCQMTAANGLLTLTTRTGTAFSVPIAEVAAKSSMFGTMTLTAAGQSYDMIPGMGSALAADYTPAQLASVESARGQAAGAGWKVPGKLGSGVIVGATTSYDAVVTGSGLIDSFILIGEMRSWSKSWLSVLGADGAKVG